MLVIAALFFCANIKLSRPVPPPISKICLQSGKRLATQAPKTQASVVTFIAQLFCSMVNDLNLKKEFAIISDHQLDLAVAVTVSDEKSSAKNL